ncbi:hypothetical protein Lfu02_69730 [Longispora fulva]|nr:hypothetical protein Lfu02_69730 [Longispora fulva]
MAASWPSLRDRPASESVRYGNTASTAIATALSVIHQKATNPRRVGPLRTDAPVTVMTYLSLGWFGSSRELRR